MSVLDLYIVTKNFNKFDRKLSKMLSKSIWYSGESSVPKIKRRQQNGVELDLFNTRYQV